MKKAIFILFGLFFATNVHGVLLFGGNNCLHEDPPSCAYCDGKLYENLNSQEYLNCVRQIEQRRLEEIREAEERAKRAKQEEEDRIRSIIKEEIEHSELVSNSQELIRENTLLKEENAKLKRAKFDLEERVEGLLSLIDRQMKIIETFKILMSRLL